MPRSQSAIGRNNQRKGKQFQKTVCRKLADTLRLPFEELYSSMAGVEGCDVSLSRAARRWLPFAIECKNAINLSIPSWIRQAEEQAKKAGYPFLLVFKMHRGSKEYVVLELDEFMNWVK